MKAYLAGPDVFYPEAQQIGLEKKQICKKYGIEGLFPLDNEIAAQNLVKAKTADAIFDANCEAMNTADFVIANMMPFRGVSTDAGTAFEIGYMFAQGKPVFGYGTDGLTYLERVVRAGLGTRADESYDRDGMRVEDFDLADNLMLICAVRRYGVDVVYRKGDRNDLSAFTKCVQLAVERLRLLGIGR